MHWLYFQLFTKVRVSTVDYCSKNNLWMGFNSLKATEPLQRDSLFFTTNSPGVPGTHFIDCGSQTWSQPVVLNSRPNDWESSALTIGHCINSRSKCSWFKPWLHTWLSFGTQFLSKVLSDFWIIWDKVQWLTSKTVSLSL